jgi:hypothetical protein
MLDVSRDGITEGPVGRIVDGGALDNLLELVADECVTLDGDGRERGLVVVDNVASHAENKFRSSLEGLASLSRWSHSLL